MQNDPDYQMAVLLQQQFNLEYNTENPSQDLSYKKNKKKTGEKSLIDPSWEVIDPTPNVYVLFVQFNERFFWGKLYAVAVNWSKRMTSCAGICSYQGRGGLCQITLSEPLLKLRPRKDLVETLLHEMIHAYLFVTDNNKDRDGHGPEFHKHMYRINAEVGTNITVYHDFHDEVRLYLQHWWRCDGPCQKRPPYFGMVRRAMNRAPGPNDRWFAEHQATCGGKFIKVKEPEKKKSKTKASNFPKKSPTKSVPNLPDIRKFLPVINNNSTDCNKNQNIPVFSGEGQKLSKTTEFDKNDYNIVRNHWINKFTNTNQTVKRKSLNFETTNKKPKVEETKASSSNYNENFTKQEINSLKDSCLSVDDSIKSEFTNDSLKMVECPVCKTITEEDCLNSHLDECLGDSTEETKDNKKRCDICESFVSSDAFPLHVQDCLMKCYDGIEKDLDLKPTVSSDTVLCLVCNKSILKDVLNEHLEDCMVSVFDEDNFNEDEKKTDESRYNCPICMICVDENKMNNHIDECLNTAALKNEFVS